MLGMITTTTHNRIVAEKDAEIAGLMKRLANAEYQVDMATNAIVASNVISRQTHEAMTLLTCQLAEARTRLAPFTTPRTRDDKGRFIKDTVA